MSYEAQLAALGFKATNGLRRLAAAETFSTALKAVSKEGTFELRFKDGVLSMKELPKGTVCSSPVMLMPITPIPLASLTHNPLNERAD